MIDTINDGTIYLRGASPYEYFAHIGRYAADHGVAFLDLLNTVDEGQLQHTKLCLLSSKTNRTILNGSMHISNDSSYNVNYRFR